MNCCTEKTCGGTDKFFSRWSKTYAKRHRKKGLEKVQQHLLEGIRLSPVRSAEVLDIGCGVGALHFALLKEGAVRATGVDVAEGMLTEARKAAEEQGLQRQTNYILGDFTSLAQSISQADITMLDKVVCCYARPADLVVLSLDKTRRVYALSHPRERFIVRWGFKTQIFFAKLFRAAFHPYWHDWASLREMITSKGFHPVYQRNTFLWSVAVFERA